MDTNLGLTHSLKITGVTSIDFGTATAGRIYNVWFYATTSYTALNIYAGINSLSSLALTVPLATNGTGNFDSHCGIRIPVSNLWINTCAGFQVGWISYSTEL